MPHIIYLVVKIVRRNTINHETRTIAFKMSVRGSTISPGNIAALQIFVFYAVMFKGTFFYIIIISLK